ncbi:hypothetical protein Taro_003963 [Colocasia esculenta]|uniref:Uncharacterized protein n=1 Tax=Colocasia esculenta TaxID=4460 RepID=A0A843TKV8_COLES|nr:hypothetical protein [Colocasia esculenta]
MCLHRLERGGGALSYEEAPTGSFFTWRSRSGRDGLASRDEIATLPCVATWSRWSDTSRAQP